ncbi:hypothetical protein D869_gp260 [Caulobacter phage CcrRogue]|uniref:Uncharacterized protein n=1 Tax=Caulobacter phage CcrRogue TaxID=2927986 RepID=K4JN61_9CAUD|nr:hypothetical protein D869_gp260 [Caulobacter phage CcrRogue]AFU86654.1 hypothetical protein CcrRogue_gp172 [Caulobacter phage CcrRogue]
MKYILFSLIVGVIAGLGALFWAIKHETKDGVLKLSDAVGAVFLGVFVFLGVTFAWPLAVPGFLIALAIWFFVNKGSKHGHAA